MDDGDIGAGATGELSSDASVAPRPLKRWHVLVVGRTATTVEESPGDERGAVAPNRRREGPLGPERPVGTGG
jgi:hypothetical protein